MVGINRWLLKTRMLYSQFFCLVDVKVQVPKAFESNSIAHQVYRIKTSTAGNYRYQA